MLWPDVWGLRGRLTFQRQLKKKGVGGMGEGGGKSVQGRLKVQEFLPLLWREEQESASQQGRSYGNDPRVTQTHFDMCSHMRKCV